MHRAEAENDNRGFAGKVKHLLNAGVAGKAERDRSILDVDRHMQRPHGRAEVGTHLSGNIAGVGALRGVVQTTKQRYDPGTRHRLLADEGIGHSLQRRSPTHGHGRIVVHHLDQQFGRDTA